MIKVQIDFMIEMLRKFCYMFSLMGIIAIKGNFIYIQLVLYPFPWQVVLGQIFQMSGCSELMYSVIFDHWQYWTISWTKLIFDDHSVPKNMTTKRDQTKSIRRKTALYTFLQHKYAKSLTNNTFRILSVTLCRISFKE